MTPDDSPPDQSPASEPDADASNDTAGDATGDVRSGANSDATATTDGDVDTSTDAGHAGADGSGPESKTRDVVVPMRVYKAVTVFTTLFAVATVVGGFIVLDSATNRATASLSEVDPLLALFGVGLIVVGAAAYAFSTRFRTEGMGKSKDDTDEPSDNG